MLRNVDVYGHKGLMYVTDTGNTILVRDWPTVRQEGYTCLLKVNVGV